MDGRRWLRTGDPAATVFGSFCATFWLFWSGRMLDAGDDFEDRDRRVQGATKSVCERRFSGGSRNLVCRCDMMSRDKLATAVGGSAPDGRAWGVLRLAGLGRSAVNSA